MNDTTVARRQFLLCLLGLIVFRLIAASVRISPGGLAAVLTVVVTVVFVAGSILALYRGAAGKWTLRESVIFLLVGVFAHVGGLIVLGQPLPGAMKIVIEALAQTGIMAWCFGLGSLLCGLIKDKNLLLPIAIFLAGFDAFLILTPTSLPQQIMQSRPEVFKGVAVAVPTVAVGPAVYIGPADFFFLSMFFVALFRFEMRTSATLKALIPTLAVYLLIVLFLGDLSLGPISLGALPALVPIGLVLLLVNRSEFKLKKDEVAATAVVAIIAVGLAGLGYKNSLNSATKPAARPAISQPVPAPESQGLANSPSLKR